MVEALKTNEQDSLTAPRACRTRCQSMFQRDLQKSEKHICLAAERVPVLWGLPYTRVVLMSDTCHVRLMSVEMSVTTSGLMSIRMPDRMSKNGFNELKYQPRLFGPRCKKYVINVFCVFLPEHTSSTMSEVMSAEDTKIDVRNSCQ